MHLLNVEIPEFRVLKNVDITFEKEFRPKIFPLGSENGGGKSTLLQLIFALLHCSAVPDGLPYLRNILESFKGEQDKPLESLAKFDIWDGKKIVKVEFLICNEFILEGEVSSSLSIFTQLETTALEVKLAENELESAQKNVDNKLYSITEGNIILSRLSKKLTQLKERYEALLSIAKTITAYFAKENLFHITNYTQTDKKTSSSEILALLCRIDGVSLDNVKSFLTKISQKVFLIAPSTQIYLFFSSEINNSLFKTEQGYFKHQEMLGEAKLKLDNFSTYNVFSTDTIVQFFKEARDKDFANAVETGEYGKYYKTFLSQINRLLTGKKLSPNPDLSGIRFTLDKNGNTVELYPPDLSHGELKRLIIYAWLKGKNIQDAIVLMDEIENTFHPDWQYQIVADLNDWGPTNQYILATHSYELCQALTPSHVKVLEPPLISQIPN